MKKLNKLFLTVLLIAPVVLFFSCASVDKTEQTSVQEEIITYPLPPENLPKLVNKEELTFSPKKTAYEQIYVKLFLPERPEENLVDIYIYDKTKHKYVCYLANCYFDTIQEESFTGLGVFWSTWASQNAYFLIDLDRYALFDKEGNEY